MAYEFEWDPAKADANFRKHEVSFDEAVTVFVLHELGSLAPDSPRVASMVNMKKPRPRSRPRSDPDRDTMRPEYDFSKATRGEIAARFREGTNIVVIAPAVRDVFPDSEAVNEALRALAPVLRRQNKTPRKQRSA